MFHRFLFWPLLQDYAPFDELWDFSAIFAPNFVKLIHGFGIRKEVTTYFLVFPEGFRA